MVKFRIIIVCFIGGHGTLHTYNHGHFWSTIIKLRLPVTKGVFVGHPNITESHFMVCGCCIFFIFTHDIDLLPEIKNSLGCSTFITVLG